MEKKKKVSDLSHLFHYLILPHTFLKSPTFFQSVRVDPPLFSNPRINTDTQAKGIFKSQLDALFQKL